MLVPAVFLVLRNTNLCAWETIMPVLPPLHLAGNLFGNARNL
jgi:hypothetical protein